MNRPTVPARFKKPHKRSRQRYDQLRGMLWYGQSELTADYDPVPKRRRKKYGRELP